MRDRVVALCKRTGADNSPIRKKPGAAEIQAPDALQLLNRFFNFDEFFSRSRQS